MSIHGHARRGHRSREYRAWEAMVRRCHQPKDRRYADYGGRGIRVCPSWRDSFPTFLADMGYCPEGLTLERRKNSRGYSPANCYWATPKAQARNRRSTRLHTYRGETLCLKDWAAKIGMNYQGFYSRVRRHGFQHAITQGVVCPMSS